MPEMPDEIITFLFTDIQGSTRMWGEHPDAMPAALALHDKALRAGIERNNGRVFQIVGDAFCAAFSSPGDALSAAVDAQKGLRDENWNETGRLKVRMAIYTGTAKQRGTEYFGFILYRVSRLMSAAHGDQILVSHTTEDLLGNTLPEDMVLRDLGVYRLKDMRRPEQIYQLTHPELVPEFPPLRSLEAFAHNLPVQLTTFVGRDQQVEEVTALLAKTRVMTLLGTGGVGKTRLSLQVGAELGEEYRDGVWLVELAALTDPGLVVDSLASVLGVQEESGRSLVDTVSDYLIRKQALLILDNCEHVVDACAELVDVLVKTCPELGVLATSREVLGIAGETVWQVPSLVLPDIQESVTAESLALCEATNLFVDRAMAANPRFAVSDVNASAIAQICQRLDGIPLAIELAAARVRALSVEQIADRLADRFNLLVTGNKTALPRHQTLRAAVEWSFDLLAEPETALFNRLSVFSGGLTLEGAEEVGAGGAIEKSQVLELLAQLVDKSLVLVDQDIDHSVRYTMLETLRQYGQENLLSDGDRESARKRHASHFLDFAKMAEPELRRQNEADWLNRLDKDHDNLRAALTWTVEHEAPEMEIGLAGAIWRFWLVRGFLEEGRRWMEGALSRNVDALPDVRANALNGAAGLAWHQGDFRHAQKYLEEALEIRRDSQDAKTIAILLDNLGAVVYSQGDFLRATELREECLMIRRTLGDTRGIADSLNNLGFMAREQLEFESATALLRESLTLYRELKDQGGIARALLCLSEVELSRDARLAMELIAESLELFETIPDRWGIAQALNSQAMTFLALGDISQATGRLIECLDMSTKMGDKLTVASTLEGMAKVANAENDAYRAARLIGGAESLRTVIGGPLYPYDRLEIERNTAAAKTRLGQAAYLEAWTAGQSMAMEDVVAYASNLSVSD
ncbi:MAG: tetratricopeptide repeat protein [SAR202 cluster bacterium]|jgi:predicted ATPase/class 3 adenylate cyclase|nr:tetratricopeptide repeat protein [SAR202 cluster bacterium]MDP6713423.1 tetratricopeptide repeat protein [SAR202 cluster bacterium]